MNDTSDLILGPILGGLSDTSVNIWGRANAPGILHAWVGLRGDLSDARLVGKSPHLSERYGYAGVAPVSGLSPNTRYFYDLRLNEQPPPIQEGYSGFTTFPPAGNPSNFSFVFGSCFRPALEGGGKIFKSLNLRKLSLEHTHSGMIRFGIFLGDQIYSDDYNFNGLNKINHGAKKAAGSLVDYRNVYEYTWSNIHFRNLLKNLPVFMTLDDHEVDDDWRWTNLDRTHATLSIYSRFLRWLKRRPIEERILTGERIQNAINAYWEHQGMHAPELISPFAKDNSGKYIFSIDHPGSFSYCFTYGAAAFFVLDTRTNRIKNLNSSLMLGNGQWNALKEWLLITRDKYPVKFLVSSSSVLYSMFGDFLGDRWSGFRAERDELLKFIGDNRITNLYILAGDLHSAHSMTAECGSIYSPVLLHEFCSTPFEQKCNKYARILYTPIKTSAVHHPRREFVITKPNFGKVTVRFNKKTPEVTFSLYGTEGELLAPK